MSIKQISVILDEQSGTLSEMSKVLSDKNVEMRALTVYEAGKFRVVRIITDNVLWASSALWQAGFTADTADVLAVAVPDEEGGLTRVLNTLEKAGIEIKYMYSVLSRKKITSLGGGMPVIVFSLNDNEKASEVLEAEGIKVLRQSEFSAL